MQPGSRFRRRQALQEFQRCHEQISGVVAPGERGRLSCRLYQRSAEIFLVVPFNMARDALLAHMLARQFNLEVRDFIWTGGDRHRYGNHREQVALRLSRESRPLPQLQIKRRPASIFDHDFEDFETSGYAPHPAIKKPVAV